MAAPVVQKELFSSDSLTALEAIDRAQLIAFAPYVWEASRLLRDKGILRLVEQRRQEGMTLDELVAAIPMSRYGIRILVEAGLGIGLLYRRDNSYLLTKTGHIFLNHQMTTVNYEFMRDVCAEGARYLEAAIEGESPIGLGTLGPWPTLYEGLSQFPEPAKSSWLKFDHYYSDHAFPEALNIVFKQNPSAILDIGANTGKWSQACLRHDPGVRMGLVDLEGQLAMARENLDQAGFGSRVNFYMVDMLRDDSCLPTGYPVHWMSQFLDCFSDSEIVSILRKCHTALPDEGCVFVNETFWDRQRFETSAFALQMTSLYFTTMANGNSQMYDSRVFYQLIEQAGFRIENEYDGIGLSHTLLELRKK